MANLAICKKCRHCLDIYPAQVDAIGKKVYGTTVACDISVPYIGWDSEVPEDCLFIVEQLVTKSSIADLAEEAIELKE